MTIDIICPLYNAEKYINNLHQSIKKQKDVEIKNVNYILTKGNDNTETILKNLDCKYEVIEKEKFSHSLTREKAALQSKADILVLITQDIIIERDDWLSNLTKCIQTGECEASYSRQICSNNTIEKYTRERNYPNESFIVSKNDIEKKGLQTFFFSDASSAIKRETFVMLNGYDGKKLPINEDMYFAFKLITNGYKIKYCADSVVEHSHKFTLKQLYKRYYDTGLFFKQNSYLNKYKVNQAGGGMALYVLKRAIQDKNIPVLIQFIPNMAARFIGMKFGNFWGRSLKFPNSNKKDRPQKFPNANQKGQSLEGEKMEKDLISIIIPVYNVEKYLRNCLDSVLAQTYKNIEIILVDDGSTDTCPEICDEYAKKDSRIKVIHKENGGLSDARNAGIQQAKGKYITFIDSDDDVLAEYIEYMYKLLVKNNTKMAIATHTVVSKKKRINFGEGYTEKILTTEECLDRMLCDKGFSISAWAKLYSKNLFNEVRFPKGKLNEDNGTTYKLILQCDKIAYGNKSIYNYYKRQNSITTSKFNLKKMDLVELTDNMCDEIDYKYPNLKDSTDKKRVTSRFSVLRQMALSKLNKEEADVEKQIGKYIKQRKKQILENKKMSKRDKIALITLMMGKSVFAFSWKVYCKLKY